MSKAFDTIKIHTLIRKLLHTKIPGTIIKFITNYINGRKAYKTNINHTSSQRQFKTGVTHGGFLSPTLYNIYITDIKPPREPVQVMAYADDITIRSTHTSMSAANKYIPPYLHKVFAWTKRNNLTLNPDNQLALCSLQTLQNIRAIWTKINNTALPIVTHTKVLGLTLIPKNSHTTHTFTTYQYKHTRHYK